LYLPWGIMEKNFTSMKEGEKKKERDVALTTEEGERKNIFSALSNTVIKERF